MVMVNKAFKNKERDYGNYNFFIFKIDFLSLIQWVLKKKYKNYNNSKFGIRQAMLRDKNQIKIFMKLTEK